jgi:hypothetical protein
LAIGLLWLEKRQRRQALEDGGAAEENKDETS